MKKLLCVIASITLMAALLTGCSSQATTPDSIKKTGKLIIATSPDYPPFEFMDGDKPAGIDMEIAAAIAKDLGVELQVDTMDFNGVLAAISSGKCDLGLSALSIKPERLENMDFSDPYFDSVVKIAVQAGNTEIKGSADLSGKKVSAQMGTIAAGLAEELGAEVIIMNKDSEAVAELVNGRVDAFMTDSSPAAVHVANSNGALKLLDEDLAYDDQYCIATKKGNTDLIAAVNETLKKLKDSGELDSILQKHLGG